MSALNNVLVIGGSIQPEPPVQKIGTYNTIVIDPRNGGGGGGSYGNGCEAIIGFKSLLPDSAFSGQNEDPNYPLSNAFDFRDNTQYSPSINSGTIQIEFTQTVNSEIDYIGIGIHNSFSAGLSAKLEVFTAGEYKEVAIINPVGDNKTITQYFEPELCNKQRLTLTFTNKLFIGCIYIGKGWAFDKSPNLGFTPAATNNLDQMVGFTSDTNQFIIGRRVKKGFGQSGQFDFINFNGKNSFNSEYIEYMNHVKDGKPIFMLWSKNIKQAFFGRPTNINNLQPPSYNTNNTGTFFFDYKGFD